MTKATGAHPLHDSCAPTRPHFLIEALSGEIVEQWEGLTRADAIGRSGQAEPDRESGGYRLRIGHQWFHLTPP